MTTHITSSTRLGKLLLAHQHVLTTAESCTGGGVATAVTDIAGSSAWFDRAFVTYSNEAKIEMLGVKESTLDTWGAVSEPIVEEMVLGALQHSNATMAVSISGIAGPAGGSVEKPVGTVCFGFADSAGWLMVSTQHFSGDRSEVRTQAVEYALTILCDYLGERS
ncbi:nicotinamide-nucleotide amidase [Vibrio panuliri]|uniref:Damage-inducible protein CinA n=1 Tax=Vibrio panuliri TaxID=1381081 RepID=A0ABX3FDX8_9VIBR|nr:nicotinamide-nucleotide amidase [Vibrio panuliri]KAB1459732.1 nicotinamide-nucleotide amidase [Vibrio panuliri]OLQ90056.1 damage-inducible protein CinA [Vibrio panuliri]